MITSSCFGNWWLDHQPYTWWHCDKFRNHTDITRAGPRFNIKMSSYQYRKSHCGDKTVVRSSYLHNGTSYTGKMSSLYWIGALFNYIRQIHVFNSAFTAGTFMYFLFTKSVKHIAKLLSILDWSLIPKSTTYKWISSNISVTLNVFMVTDYEMFITIAIPCVTYNNLSHGPPWCPSVN